MTYVLWPQDIGLHIGNVFYSPTSWMLAEIGEPSRARKSELLAAAVENVKSSPGKAAQVPSFSRFLEHKSRVTLDDLTPTVEYLYGIDKLLTEKAVRKGSDDKYTTISMQNQVVAYVNTRQDARETDRRVHRVSLTDPFFFADQSSIQTAIGGASEHADFNRLRWTLLNGSEKDEKFIGYLQKVIAKRATSKGLPPEMLKSLVVRDLRGKIDLADYHSAAVLLQLNESLKEKRFSDFTGLERFAKASVIVPYQFEGKEEYLWDALLMLKELKSKKDPNAPPRYFEVSRKFIFNNILSQQSQSMMADGNARLDALVSQRLYGRQRGLLYAIVEHMYEQFRQRVGFGLEFAGTPYERISVQFKGLADVYKDPGKRDLTISLVFTYRSGTGLAFLIYKAPVGDDYDKDAVLGKRNPARLVNPPEEFIDQRKRIPPEKAYLEIDPLTHGRTRNSIFPVNDMLLKRAEKFSEKLGMRYNAASERYKYLPYYQGLKPRYQRLID